jgi:uncharacterized damage-inducible protein DinB
MSQTRTEMFRRWFDYERDSHTKVLGALEAVPAARRDAPEFRKAAQLFAHIIEARRLWLLRMGAAREGPALADMLPDVVDLAGLRPRLEAMHDAWARHLDTLDDDAIARHFEYRSFEGERFRNTVVDILTQLYGHSLYHRGQIALLMRAMGAEPVPTDFLFWTREALDPPRG